MKTTYLAAALLILLVSLSACNTIRTQPSNENNMMEDDPAKNKDSMMDENKAMEENNDAMMEEDNDAMMEKEDTMMEENNDAMMEKTDSMMEENNDTMMEKEDSMMEENSMMQKYEGEVLAGTSAKYMDFTKEDYELALSENKVVVLYFYATWCPTCRAEQPEAFEAFNEMDKENVVGFRVNYKDSDTDEYEAGLAKEFGITYQHTKVILKDGVRVLKSPESWDSARYIEEISKFA